MRILHFCLNTDKEAARHIEILMQNPCAGVEQKACGSLIACNKLLRSWNPDIVHLHGCWHLTIAAAGRMAVRRHARIVLTPHGSLEPWILKQKYLTEKLPKLLLYQRRCIKRAYSIIAFGRMEAEYLRHLGYNPRIEIVHNSMVTDSISDSEMANGVCNVYRKVLNTDVFSLMDDRTRTALRALIKAGISGDSRWLNNAEYDSCKDFDRGEWHKIAVFACQENINDIISKGLAVLELDPLPPLYSSVDSYEQPGNGATRLVSATPAHINADKLLAAIRQSRKWLNAGTLRIRHLAEFADILRHGSLDEKKLADMLAEKKLAKYTSRLMSVLADTTGLEEGFMPVPEKKDRGAGRMERNIIKHFEI